MLAYVCLSLALLVASPVYAQLESTPFDLPSKRLDEAPMLTPPPVSNKAYPAVVGSQLRSNYVAAGLVFNTAYNDNVLQGGSENPAGDVIYSFLPTITFDQTTARQHLGLLLSPGFTIYQHTSSLNAADLNLALNYQYRLTQHTTVSFDDSFQKSSNVFNQSYPFSGATISGSSQSLPPGVIAPYASQLSNTANGGISYQFGYNSMAGASGIITESSYPNPVQAAGLYNSNSGGGSAFYNQRLSNAQYVGVTYQYLRSEGNPVDPQTSPTSAQSTVQTHSLLPFYTIYLNPTFSLSFSGGPQYYNATQPPSPSLHAWFPSAMASIGWQTSHTNLVASYSRTITAAIGLPGAFNSNNANASARWQAARTWNLGGAASYSINKNVTPLFLASNPGGHSISVSVTVQYSLSEHLKTELGYTHLHQSYNGISAISTVPNTNREFISISYQFTRPVGR
jgi:hypothetical protein